jgi:hypothetical protein
VINRISQDQAGDIWQGIAARWGRERSFAPWHRSSNRRPAAPRDHFHQSAAGSCSASGFLDLNLLLLLRHLRWLWQLDMQYALIKFCLDLRRVRIEWQRDRPAKRAIAAFHHVPVLVLVLFIARGLFLTADGQHPISECYVEIFLITPGNSAVTSIASLVSATSTFGESMSDLTARTGHAVRSLQMSFELHGIATQTGHRCARRMREDMA